MMASFLQGFAFSESIPFCLSLENITELQGLLAVPRMQLFFEAQCQYLGNIIKLSSLVQMTAEVIIDTTKSKQEIHG